MGGSALSLLPDPARVAAFGEPHYALAFARIECHYFQNRGFFERDDQLIANAGVLRDIPGVIVHGRYDLCTPVLIAWDLHRAWPEADLRIVADSGHAMTEPGIIHELVAATETLQGKSSLTAMETGARAGVMGLAPALRLLLHLADQAEEAAHEPFGEAHGPVDLLLILRCRAATPGLPRRFEPRRERVDLRRQSLHLGGERIDARPGRDRVLDGRARSARPRRACCNGRWRRSRYRGG